MDLFGAGVANSGVGILRQIIGSKTRVQFIQGSTGTVLSIDASIREQHGRKTTATQVPIESGENASDHIIKNPLGVEITGIISDTPIGGLQGLLAEAGSSVAASLVPPIGIIAGATAFALFSALVGSKRPSVQAYAQLLQLQDQGEPLDVITSLFRYPKMYITEVSVPRDPGTGQCLLFTVTLSQLLITSPQSVNIQLFANPGLSANKADVGEAGNEALSAAQAGRMAGISFAGGAP